MPIAPGGDQREPWMQFGGLYRPINDLSQPWVASPVVTTPQTLPPTKSALPVEHRAGSSFSRIPIAQPVIDSGGGSPGTNKRRKGWGLLERFRGSSKRNASKSLTSSVPGTESVVNDRVPLAEWKAYGYYACPNIDGVRGAAPWPMSPDVDIQGMFDSLRSVDGDHPERWISGTQHTALPPRPTRWKVPNPHEPLPFPWECQDPSMLCYGTVETMIPISRADRIQPATYPFLTHMFINAIGDDPIQPFLWPFMVRNPEGIKCEDIYNAVYENFQQYVSQSEYYDWPQVRQIQVTKAYRARLSSRSNHNSGFVEGIQRVDYLGDNIMFRGLEPNPNIDGWVMFVGRTW